MLNQSQRTLSGHIQLKFKESILQATGTQNQLTLKLTSMVEFGNRTKSNSRSKSWAIELNRTLHFRTLDSCKTRDENQCNKCLEVQLFRYNTASFLVFFVNAHISGKWLQMRSKGYTKTATLR